MPHFLDTINILVKFKDNYLHFPVNVEWAVVLFFGGISYWLLLKSYFSIR